MILQTSEDVTQVCHDTLTDCSTGTFPGRQRFVYKTVAVLSDTTCTSWKATYAESARNTSDNLNGGTLYIETSLDLSLGDDFSPYVGSQWIPYACLNTPFTPILMLLIMMATL